MNINWHQIICFVKHCVLAHRKGHGVHSPFAFQLCEEVFYNQNLFYDFEKLNEIRQQLLHDQTLIEVKEFGAGSKILKHRTRLVKDITRHGISSQRQSELIYRLLNFLNCKQCVELGTSIGLNALYMASVNQYIKVISIEACDDLFLFAKTLAIKNEKKNIQFIHSTFDEALPQVLNHTTELDFIYIDGNHTYNATCKYFNWLLEKVHSNTVIVLDDIYWSADMTRAWEEIRSHQKVSLSIDTFYFGILFFSTEIKEKINLRLFI